MTVREQIFIEDKYRELKNEHERLCYELEHAYDNGLHNIEIDELINQLTENRRMIAFIDKFITYSYYKWRELASGWTLFEIKEEGV